MTRPIEPIPEAYAGQNNPYRGIEQHGVETENRYQPVPGYGDTVQVEYEHPGTPQEPVPVIVVNESGHEERAWAVVMFTVTDRLMQVMGRDRSRTSLKITNNGPNTVYLCHNAQTNTACMYPVVMNESFSVDAETEVWGLCAPTESAALKILRQFTRSLPDG